MTDLRRAAQDALDILDDHVELAHLAAHNGTHIVHHPAQRLAVDTETVRDALRSALAQPAPNSPPNCDGWIACETRMPEPGTRCMVYVRGASTEFVDVDEFVSFRAQGLKFSGCDWLSYCLDEVAHWRPLPPPPPPAQEDTK